MIRVGINLLWMVPKVVGGSETYTTRLLQGLAESRHGARDLDYRLFALPQFASAHPDLASHFAVEYAPVTGQWKSFRVAGENTWLARQTQAHGIDVLHHAGGTVPFVRTGRTVLTLHDLQYLFYPEYFTRAKLTFLKTMVPRSAEAARLILTPSDFTRRTIIERLNIDPSIVVTVPHGISPREDRVEDPDVRHRFEIPDRYFLYPAATYPHKNHLVLIDALERLHDSHPDAALVFTGPAAWKEWATAKQMEERLGEEIRRRGLDASVKRLGYVSERDLTALYQDATAIVFPSRFEGFGAPVLEAMARGCAVIAANATAIPEIVGTNGVLCSPDNAEEWTEAMRDLIEDGERRAQLQKAGRERARQFEWTRSTTILEDSYRAVMATTL